MAWRLAKCLETLRTEVNAKWPNRSKASDGTIGDESHQTRESDHNPWVKDGAIGVVTAMDITHDPAHGLDSEQLAECLRGSKDLRIKYIISNRKIASSENSPWEWRPYTGTNPHNHHVHISVKSDKAHYDMTSSWPLDGVAAPAPGQAAGTIHPTLRRGASGEAVKELQRLLGVKDDGNFGPATEAAVREKQAAAGIVVDGIVGPHTWEVLGAK
jgi:Putative peptidoglycan binding domain